MVIRIRTGAGAPLGEFMKSFQYGLAFSILAASTACSNGSSKNSTQSPVTVDATSGGSNKVQLAAVTPIANFTPSAIPPIGPVNPTLAPTSTSSSPKAVLIDIGPALDAAIGSKTQRQAMASNLAANSSLPVIIPISYGANQQISTTFGNLINPVDGTVNRLLLQFPAGDSRGLIVFKFAGLPTNINAFQTADGSVIVHSLINTAPVHNYYFARIDTYGNPTQALAPVRSDVVSYTMTEFGASTVTTGWSTPSSNFGAGDVVFTGYGSTNAKLSQIVVKANGYVTIVYSYTGTINPLPSNLTNMLLYSGFGSN